jgi:hypothetical protein
MKTFSIAFALLIVPTSLACQKEPSPAPGPATTAGSSAQKSFTSLESAAVNGAESAAKTLGKRLRERLSAAMVDGGPKVAIDVCLHDAPHLREQVTKETGARVGRSSLRLRTPKDAGPAWVSDWLRAQGERKTSGIAKWTQIAQTQEGPVARVILPIEIEAACLPCHGPKDTLDSEIRARLMAAYPEDQAVGYTLGDLRGALWEKCR